jgi:hypothetical protein
MLPFLGINVKTSRRNSSIFIHLFNYLIDQSIHMMENALMWRRWTPYIHCIHLFDQSISDLLISFIKRSWRTVPRCGGGRGFCARAEERRRWRREEEAGVGTAVEETGSSGIDGGRVDWRSRERRSRRER